MHKAYKVCFMFTEVRKEVFYYGSNSYGDDLTPRVTEFGDGASKEIIKIPGGYGGRVG